MLLHGLGFADLDKLQEAFDGQRLNVQPQQYGLTQRELNALFNVRNLVKKGKADVRDIWQFCHILIQAEKRRYLYPVWRKEERIDKLTLSPQFFRDPDLSLLQLLAGEDRPAEFVAWRPDGHLKLLHLWPGQTPPPRRRDRVDFSRLTRPWQRGPRPPSGASSCPRT